MEPWHEQDAFWEEAWEILFPLRRWDAAEREVNGFLKLTGLNAQSCVLDLCCGVGRHALMLAQKGFRVTGVDRTAAYLEAGRAKAREQGVSVEFVQEDMRTFRREAAFDGAIWFYTSIGFFEDEADDIRVLEHLYASLKPGGSVAVETRGREDVQSDFQERDWHELDGGLILEERLPSEDWKHMDIRWIRILGTERREMRFRLRLYSRFELQSMMSRVGFRGVQVRGGLDGRPYNEEAVRLVLVGTKPE